MKFEPYSLMEGECATSPSNSSSRAGAEGASRLLANLPSRGILPSTVVPSNQVGIRVYICDHNTSPPEEQLIKTNQTNILIRSLTLKKQKSEPSLKDTKGKATAVYTKAKRAAERAVDVKPLAKKANVKNSTGSPQQVGTSTRMVQKDLQSLTVERLRAFLKERHLSIKGKKDELIARLKGNRSDGQP